jgi:hypothetical protein
MPDEEELHPNPFISGTKRAALVQVITGHFRTVLATLPVDVEETFANSINVVLGSSRLLGDAEYTGYAMLHELAVLININAKVGAVPEFDSLEAVCNHEDGGDHEECKLSMEMQVAFIDAARHGDFQAAQMVGTAAFRDQVERADHDEWDAAGAYGLAKLYADTIATVASIVRPPAAWPSSN